MIPLMTPPNTYSTDDPIDDDPIDDPNGVPNDIPTSYVPTYPIVDPADPTDFIDTPADDATDRAATTTAAAARVSIRISFSSF